MRVTIQKEPEKVKKTFNKKLLLIPGGLLVAVVIVLITFFALNNNSSMNNEVEELKEAYKENGITLTNEDYQIKNNEIEVTNQDKAQEYKNKLNDTLADILNSNTGGSSGDGFTPSDPDNPDPAPTPQPGPDIDSMLNNAKEKLDSIDNLYQYFDNSKYIDMNTGETYDQKYQKEYETWHEQYYNKMKEIQDQHPEMSESEFLTWWMEHESEFNLPVCPTYDESMPDIELSQLTKGEGLLNRLGRGNFDNKYGESMALYCTQFVVNTTNVMNIISVNNPPMNSCLTGGYYLKKCSFSADNAILNQVSKSYADGAYQSIISISTNGYTLYFGVSGNNYLFLDIE